MTKKKIWIVSFLIKSGINDAEPAKGYRTAVLAVIWEKQTSRQMILSDPNLKLQSISILSATSASLIRNPSSI